MDSEGFVDAIKHHVGDAAVEDTITNLKHPPGRKVSLKKRILSEWYNGLSTEETGHVNDVIANAVHAALFGFFAVLDGERKIENEGGRFELAFLADQRVLLNPQEIGLHDLLNASN